MAIHPDQWRALDTGRRATAWMDGPRASHGAADERQWGHVGSHRPAPGARQRSGAATHADQRRVRLEGGVRIVTAVLAGLALLRMAVLLLTGLIGDSVQVPILNLTHPVAEPFVGLLPVVHIVGQPLDASLLLAAGVYLLVGKGLISALRLFFGEPGAPAPTGSVAPPRPLRSPKQSRARRQ